MMNITEIDGFNTEGHTINPGWNNSHKISINDNDIFMVIAALDSFESQDFGIRMWFSYTPMGLRTNPFNENLNCLSLSKSPTKIFIAGKDVSKKKDNIIRITESIVWINIQNIEGRINKYVLYVEKVKE